MGSPITIPSFPLFPLQCLPFPLWLRSGQHALFLLSRCTVTFSGIGMQRFGVGFDYYNKAAVLAGAVFTQASFMYSNGRLACKSGVRHRSFSFKNCHDVFVSNADI